MYRGAAYYVNAVLWISDEDTECKGELRDFNKQQSAIDAPNYAATRPA